MDEKSLKANWWQRVIILIIAILLLGSTIFAYMFIVMSGNKNTSSSSNQEELIAELTESYDAKKAELEEAAKPFSDKYFTDFLKYNSQIKSYNSAAANAAGIETTDLKTGTVRLLPKVTLIISRTISAGVLTVASSIPRLIMRTKPKKPIQPV